MLGIVVLAVVAALVAPSFINWNAYRAEIAAEVHKATGRRLVIEGPIDVAVLPAPKLSAARVRFANLEGAAAPDMVRLEALDVRIAFWPLLSGRVVVNSVELRGADIELETLADGRVNWEFGPPRAPGAVTGGPAVSSPGAGDAVRLDRVVIADGRVTWRDSGKGTVERVERIDATLAAETLAGPFSLRGRAMARGVPLAVALRAGRIDTGRPIPLNAEVELREARAKGLLSGTFMLGDAPSANLRLDAGGDDLGRAVAALSDGGAGPAILGRPFTLSATLAGDARAFAVNDIALVLNGTRATGAVSATFGPVTEVDATFGINTLDLDAWLAAAATPRKAPVAAPPAKGTRQEAAQPAPFALPKDLRVAVDARIGGITYNKGAIRDVGFQGRLDGGVFHVARLSAQLPGGSDAALAGRVTARDGAPRFDGKLEANVADSRQMLDWLGVDHSAIVRDRLNRITFRTGLAAAGEQLELSDIDLRFDATRIGGGVVVALRERLGIGANLRLDRINLDAYLAEPAAAGPKAPAAPAKGKGEAGGQGGALAALGAFDANLRAEAQSVTLRGVTVSGLALDSTLLGGDLTLRSFRIANLAGGTLDVSGTVAALDRDPVPDLRFSLATQRPDQLFALVGIEPPVAPARISPLAFDGAFKAEAKATRLQADLAAGALKVAVAGTLADLATAPRLGLDLKADHPSFVEFVRLFDPAFTPRIAPKGPFSLEARADGAGLDVKLANVRAQFGEAAVTGEATLAMAAVRPRLTARFKAGPVVAEHFVPASLGGGAKAPASPARAGMPGPSAAGASSGAPWSDAPFELDGLRALDADVQVEAKSLLWRSWQVDAPRIEMALDDGRFELRRVSGSTVGGTFRLAGLLAAPAKKGGPAELRANLDVQRADLRQAMFNIAALDIASGTVTFRTEFAGRGASSRALVSSLAGGGSLEATEGAISGFDLGSVNERLKNLNQPAAFLGLLQTAMSGGTTRFSDLKANFKIAQGVVRSDDIALKADGGSGTATLVADLPNWQIDSNAVFRLEGHRDAPPFRMQLKGPLDAPARIFNLNELQAWLASRAVGGLLQQVLPKKQPQTQAEPAPEQQQKPAPEPRREPSPEEFIRGIFDVLQKKR